MSWKPSELLVVGLVIGAIVLWRTSDADKAERPASPPEPAFIAAQIDTPTAAPMIANIELAGEQLMLSVGGMIECDLHGALPMSAVNKYGDFLRGADGEAFLRGAAKSTLILKGLALKPRTARCKEVGRQLEKNAVLYRELASRLP